MKKNFADLHIHTNASDGKSNPEEVVRQASEAGLAAISIADHDSVNGIEGALEVSKKYGVEVVPGIELSSELKETEVHMLGYLIDWHDKQFLDLLHIIQGIRMWRAGAMVTKLNNLGIDIAFEEVLAEARTGSIGRPHIVRVMLKHGYVKTWDEAFERYLQIGRPAHVGKYEMSPVEAIQTIRSIGGIPVLAHPVFSNIDDKLPELIKEGLRGIEVYHIKHDPTVSKHYHKLARKYGLLITGGSDSHGPEEPIGSVGVPYEYVERLKAEHKHL